ncbi:MAG: Thioredoxin [Chloroflexi bacterium OLB14]|nr:MAG: Thioredoxin [Chloroflexi bacterium OLB14]
MNKKVLIILLGISMFACNFLFQQADTSTPEVSTVIPEISVTEVVDTLSPEVVTSEVLIKRDNFVVVRLHPESGDLQSMLALESQQANSLGLMPIVEFDATWCPPCIAIDKAINAENELMLNAYRGTYIIKLDVDEWGWNDSKIENFEVEAIPVYFKLDDNGEQTGEVIDGGAWGEDIPENIAPVMDSFFHSN